MSNLQANRTLSGSFAEVWVDGARIAELSQLTLTVKVQREKVQFGMDVDSKITGYAGEGTMTLKQVYTRFYEVLEQAKRGLDKRCTITTALKDPDAADGGEERYSIDNVAFTELPFMNYNDRRRGICRTLAEEQKSAGHHRQMAPYLSGAHGDGKERKHSEKKKK